MQITSLALMPGAPATHVTVGDQQGGDASGNPIDAISPSMLTFVVDPVLTGVTVTSDATGFNFSAASGTADETGNVTFTFTPNGVTGILPVTVAVTVTGLTFFSP